jgi:hypothetical protein
LRPTTCDRLARLRSSSKNPGGRLILFYIGSAGPKSSTQSLRDGLHFAG